MQGWVAKNSLDELVCCWVFLLPSSLMIDIGPVYCLISLPRLWRSLILGSDQTFVILVLFMEMLLLTSLVLNVHLVISTISSWKKCFVCFFITLSEMLTWIKISWVLDARVWMFVCWLCGNPGIDWLTCFELSAGLGKNGYSTRLQCLKVLEWLNKPERQVLTVLVYFYLFKHRKLINFKWRLL